MVVKHKALVLVKRNKITEGKMQESKLKLKALVLV
jgi:hypothetical protein